MLAIPTGDPDGDRHVTHIDIFYVDVSYVPSAAWGSLYSYAVEGVHEVKVFYADFGDAARHLAAKGDASPCASLATYVADTDVRAGAGKGDTILVPPTLYHNQVIARADVTILDAHIAR